MIGAKPTRLCFTPALPCVDCQALTTQGLIYPMSSQVKQLLPLCSKDMEESGPAGEEDELVGIDQLQRRRRQVTHAYVRLRRQRAHAKAQRALRWKLKQAYRLQAKVMKVES